MSSHANVIDFTHLSSRNTKHKRQLISVANGATFVTLDMSEHEKRKATSVLYLHVHRQTHKCYIGITIQEAGKRWFTGTTYKLNRRFGRALEKYGWPAFDSFILAFADDREALFQAEMDAIAAAGGHKSKFTYNLSPGGDFVADNNIPIVGVYLPTGEVRNFAGGAEAARVLGFASSNTPMAVVRGEIHTAQNWWFRLADDENAHIPTLWGKQYKDSQTRSAKAKPVIAVSYTTRETRRFETVDDAANELGVQQAEVSAVANGKAHSAGGWWFHFENDDRPMPELHSHNATRAKRDKKVFAVNLKTGERHEFRNCTVADQALGIYKGGAAAVALGERRSADGWWFSYENAAVPPTDYKGALVAKARSKPVIAINLATGVEQSFDSARSAAEALGMSRSLICQVISGKKLSGKGYGFRFVVEPVASACDAEHVGEL